MYYILCLKHGFVNGACNWWRPNGNGYTASLDDAGVYSKEKALEIASDYNIPIPCSVAQAHSFRVALVPHGEVEEMKKRGLKKDGKDE